MTNFNYQATGLCPQTITLIQQECLKHPNIREAWLFGSRAMGTHKPGSDIDIAIDGDLSFQQLNALAVGLDELMLPYEFDVLTLSGINNAQLIAHIQRVGKRIFQKA